MGEIRFSCERCGQQIVADASAAGLNAECPSCHLALIIPEPDFDEESEGAVVSQSEHADTQLALAYVCEQLEAAKEQCAHLSANTARIQAELHSLLAEQRVHLTLLWDYRRRLRIAEDQIVGDATASANGIGSVAGKDGVALLEAPTSKSPQTTAHLGSEKTANMENRSEHLEAELIEARSRLEEADKASRMLAGSCDELRRENAALIRALQSANGAGEQMLENPNQAHVERIHEDNGLLRGIVSRQNVLLEQWYAELTGLKRARLMLRILYALFALCLIILAIIAIDNWPLLKI
ncbi:MAG: hypothetical protein JWL59_2342 [Chthoniobacteraceae bacterium]|nr:hypothetical protein [Chthoniobacteraceae bacterium]